MDTHTHTHTHTHTPVTRIQTTTHEQIHTYRYTHTRTHACTRNSGWKDIEWLKRKKRTHNNLFFARAKWFYKRNRIVNRAREMKEWLIFLTRTAETPREQAPRLFFVPRRQWVFCKATYFYIFKRFCKSVAVATARKDQNTYNRYINAAWSIADTRAPSRFRAPKLLVNTRRR